ncbi:MAG: pilus assembly PilX N-terminal domain-containing protein [Deltaproteobacteria bacterium]|nr:pilus assembly PilX N-terminal domain-containing protein [Deltaproteobacteria bacterium]
MEKIWKSQNLMRNERGMVLVIVLWIMAILIMIGTTNVIIATTDLKISSNYKLGTQAFYASESGAEYGYLKLRDILRVLYPTINISAPTINGYTFDEFNIATVGNQQVEVMTGTYTGLTAFVTKYLLSSRAHVNGTSASARVDLLVKDNLIPIFQFGIFYQNDLEILPGANMTFTGGRIHSNNSIYLNADAGTFSIDSRVTSADEIIHGHKDTRSYSVGTVQIKDSTNTYQSMTIDSNSANWAMESQTTWDGNVKNEDHGIIPLNVPTTSGNPRDITGTGADSLYLKAGLRIVDGVAKDANGNTVNIRYYDPNYKNADGTLKIDAGGTAALNVNPLSTTSFTDKRENKVVTVTEVNLSKLQNSTTAMNALNNPPSGADPGILYVNQTDNSKSVRLTDGASIPSTGLTVVSNNAVYIKGDYNTTNNPAAIMGDAISVLSNSWDDANSNSADLSPRVASNTTINAAFMGGNVETTSSHYSGGAENYMRLLENWSGKTLTYSGSLVNLWTSQQATGIWQYGSPVYTAPTRNWSYGIDPAHLPPGTPRVRSVDKYAWQHYLYD